MVRELLSIGLPIILIVSLYLSYLQRNKLSDQLTKLLIENRIPEKELSDLDKSNRIIAIKTINQTYKLGIKNSTKVFDSLRS